MQEFHYHLDKTETDPHKSCSIASSPPTTLRLFHADLFFVEEVPLSVRKLSKKSHLDVMKFVHVLSRKFLLASVEIFLVKVSFKEIPHYHFTAFFAFVISTMCVSALSLQ